MISYTTLCILRSKDNSNFTSYILDKNIKGAEEDPAKYVIQLMFY